MANNKFTNHSGYYGAGLGNVGSYQMSGLPFISGSIEVPISGASNYISISFPRVTKSLTIRNDDPDGQVMRVAFARGGLKDRSYSTEIYLMGHTATVVDAGNPGISTYATVIAGLTNIYSDKSPTYVGQEGIDDLSGD